MRRAAEEKSLNAYEERLDKGLVLGRRIQGVWRSLLDLKYSLLRTDLWEW